MIEKQVFELKARVVKGFTVKQIGRVKREELLAIKMHHRQSRIFFRPRVLVYITKKHTNAIVLRSLPITLSS